METEDLWYQELRERYRPDQVRLLLIGESAPTDHGGTKPRNFFYAGHLGPDNLYRGVLAALYGRYELKPKTHDKPPWLRRLQADGVFLIDAVPYPVNDIKRPAERKRLVRENLAGCVARAADAGPEGIVVCGGALVYDIIAEPLRRAGLPLLHDQPISFPLGNVRQQFVDSVREAVGPLGLIDLDSGSGESPS